MDSYLSSSWTGRAGPSLQLAPTTASRPAGFGQRARLVASASGAHTLRDVRTLIVAGGDAAGMSAASAAKRALGDDIEVIVFERGHWTSYSACGIPYWVAGQVAGPDALVARSPEEHRKRGIDVRALTEVVALDTAAQTVRARGQDGVEYTTHYDDLLLATGAEPIRPNLPGIDAEGIYGVQDLEDGTRVIDALADGPACAVIVGSGYIGLEMAEACVQREIKATVIDQAREPLPLLDVELGERVHTAMTGLGIETMMNTPVRGFIADESGHVTGVQTDAETVPADVVILGIGVKARSTLAADAGLPIGVKDGIVVEADQRVAGHRNIWAAGDCALSRHRLTGELVHIPLGTHANKQGRIAGRNIAGADVEFAGVLGTAITKICALEIALTGLSAQTAEQAGRDALRVSIDTTTKAGYYPTTEKMRVVMVAEQGSRRILGTQIVGGDGAAKRIDTVATAIWSDMTVDELIQCDLAYAPPFSSVWDPVQQAARVVAAKLSG
jgi:NADPH-dependent 2,4-dienoyl-CoA reductase/sulfur reductase-like enzyme